jgi:hypothetical protein
VSLSIAGRWGLGLALATLLTGISYLAHCEVDNTLTPDDLAVLQQVLRIDAPLPLASREHDSWPEQAARIRRTVDLVYAAAPSEHYIKEGHPREPADVVRNGGGVCFDRSRFIEKALLAQGFQVRHVFMFKRFPGRSKLRILLTRNTQSHTVSEVKTVAGWVAVDPSKHWVGINDLNQPISAEMLAEAAEGRGNLHWSQPIAEFFQKPFIRIYGLYSRHGRFFPPYNAIPDVNYRELLDNFR